MTGTSLVVLDCGPATSLQDGGRRGYQRYGLSASGPMDHLALAAANVLVGKRPDAVAIELGMGGGHFRAQGGAVRFAIAGAPCPITVDGEPVAAHRTIVLRDGSELRIERPRAGVFAYLAVSGGFDVPESMGSRSLHLRAALGGLDGRALRAGDLLSLVDGRFAGTSDCMLDEVSLEREEPIRVVLGPQEDRFTRAGLATLLGERFTVSNRADRMGYQLDGPRIAHGGAGFNIVSDATVAGSVQVPGSGRPIVLLADRQTTGGYPKIATVISADLRRIAQRRPGETVRFAAVEVAAAVRLARERASDIAVLPDKLRPAMETPERLFSANVAGDVTDAFERDE